MGGHGRTGTALAILGSLIAKWEGDLTDKVREIYCNKAVETEKQIKYIEKITGVVLKKGNGSKESFFSTNGKDKGSTTTNIIASTSTSVDVDIERFKTCSNCKKKYDTITEALNCKCEDKDKTKELASLKCGICGKEYQTMYAAINCEGSHKKEESKKNHIRWQCQSCKTAYSGEGAMQEALECCKEIKGKSPKDSYFEERKKWRKEYPT